MLIDCDTCLAPAGACSGCVMTVLLRGRAGAVPGRARGAPGHAAMPNPVPMPGIELDDAERDAIGVLANAGLVPPLRLVRGVTAAEAGGPTVAAAQGIA